MTLQASGTIDFSDLNVEMGLAATNQLDLNGAVADFDDNAKVLGGTFYGSETNPDSLSEFYSASWAACFIAGTKITMGDGSFKNIEDIVRGDEVLAYNPYKEIFAPQEILKFEVVENSGGQYELTILIDLEDGTQLHCTDSNPFWVPGKYWASYNPPKCQYNHNLATNQLEEGDKLVHYDNGDATEVAITKITVVTEPTTTYSLKVKQWATFIANDIVSHNKCVDGDALVTMADGSTKPLKDLVVGDSILSFTGETFAPDTVEEIQMIPHTGIYEYQFFKDTIKATAGHPFKTLNGYASYDPDTARQDYDVECVELNPLVDALTLHENTARPVTCDKIRFIDETVEYETYIIRLANNNVYIANEMLVYTGIKPQDPTEEENEPAEVVPPWATG